MARENYIVHLFLAVAVWAAVSSATTVNELWTLLDQQGIPFDSNRVERFAVEAALKAIDPGAQLVPVDRPESTNMLITVALSEDWADGIHYLKLSGLNKGGGKDVLDVLHGWEGDECNGLIVDLRGSGGKCLDCVDAVAGALDQRSVEIYAVRDAHGTILDVHSTRGTGSFWAERPLMLLTDSGTAMASEVLASVLKHRGGVMIIGTPTQGDGALREVVPFNDDFSIYLSTRWVVALREGKEVAEEVTPDIVIDSDAKSHVTVPEESEDEGADTSDRVRSDMELMRRVADDAALARATDILLGLKALNINGEGSATSTTNPPVDAGQGHL